MSIGRETLIVFSIATIFSIGLAPNPAYATDALPGFYGSDREGNIFLFDPTIPLVTPLGSTGTTIASTEIECTNGGALCFSQGADGFFGIEEVSFNPPALVGAIVGTNNAAFNGLEYVDSTLYGTWVPSPCEPSTLATLNPLTGGFVNIGPTNTGRPMSGLAYDTVNNIMYGVDGCGNLGDSNLWTVDLGTGNAVLVGDTGQRLGSLEFGPDGKLYAGGDRVNGGDLYEISTVNGLASLVTSSGFLQVTGLTLVDIAVGGTYIPIDKTALLLAGVQSISMWMIPVVIAGVGIGVFVVIRKK